MGLIILSVFAVFQCISVFIFPFITKVIVEISTFLLFQDLACISYFMICVLTYKLQFNYKDKAAVGAYGDSISLAFISVIFQGMVFVQTNSLPYSMLKKVV